MSIISLGKCPIFYLYILGPVIFKFLETILLGYKNQIGDKIFSVYGFIPILNDFNFIKSIYTYIGYIIFGVLFLFISIKKSKNDKKKMNKNVLPKGIIHNKSYKSKTSNKIYIRILIFCFLFLFHIEVKKVLYILGFQGLNIWALDILFMLIFMKKHFKVYNYRHQSCSLKFIICAAVSLLIISSFLPFTITNNENINSYMMVKDKFGDYFYSILIFIFFGVLSYIYSFSRVLGKELMQIKYVPPYYLIISLGFSIELKLFSILFGEGVFNDAVCSVIYKILTDFQREG